MWGSNARSSGNAPWGFPIIGIAAALVLGCTPTAWRPQVIVERQRAGSVPIHAFRHIVIAPNEVFPVGVSVEVLERSLGRLVTVEVARDRTVPELLELGARGALPRGTGILVVNVDTRDDWRAVRWNLTRTSCDWVGCRTVTRTERTHAGAVVVTLDLELIDAATALSVAAWVDEELEEAANDREYWELAGAARPRLGWARVRDLRFRKIGHRAMTAARTLARRVGPELRRRTGRWRVFLPRTEFSGVDQRWLDFALDSNDWAAVAAIMAPVVRSSSGVAKADALHLWALARQLEANPGDEPARRAGLRDARRALRRAAELDPEQPMHRRALRRLRRQEWSREHALRVRVIERDNGLAPPRRAAVPGP